MTAKDLKASILQLAIQGKLVPQDPTDEPASALLARVRGRGEVVKQELGEAGGGRKTKKPHISRLASSSSRVLRLKSRALPPITDDAKPFDLPEGWAWCRFNDVFSFELKLVPVAGYLDCPHIAPDCIEKFTGKLLGYKTIGEDKVTSPKHLFKRGQILYSKIRPLLRKTIITTFDGLCSADMYPLSTIINIRYAQELLLSDFFNKQVAEIASSRVKMPKINQDELAKTILPLPPLAEQKRIVAKIEELMPMVERYGAVAEQSDALEAALPDAFRKSVLQYAIQGKLVPQDPNDEPASALLGRIAEEVAAVKKTRKTRKDKPLDPVGFEDAPFEIPDSWEWCRLGVLTSYLHRGKSPVYVESGGYPMFAQKCNQWAGVQLDKCKFCDSDKYASFEEDAHLHDYDVVINSTGTGTLGRVGLFRLSDLEPYGFRSITPDSHVTIVRTPHAILNQYLRYFFSTQYMWDWLNEHADGSTKQKELYTSTLASVLIPLPPLAEQNRIVAEVERMLALGDNIKAVMR